MSNRTLEGLVELAPEDAPCMSIQGRITTYGELRDHARRIANGLSNQGIHRGDTVAIWLPNIPEWLEVTLACGMLGVNILTLNMRYGTHELIDFMTRSACRAIFYFPRYKGMNHDQILRDIQPQVFSSLSLCIALADEGLEPFPTGLTRLSFATLRASEPLVQTIGLPQDICITFASSGTTSQPKLIQHVQRSVASHALDVTKKFRINQSSRLLLAIPFSGAFGYTIAVASMAAHATLVIQEQFDPADAATILRDQHITHTFGTDDMLDKILNSAGPTARFPSLTVFGHANFTPALATTLPQKSESHGVRLQGCYGLSEAMALFTTQPSNGTLERRAMSGGLTTCPEARVRVRSLDTNELLQDGETGEIEIYSPNLTVGYLGNTEATKKAFCEDGYLRTGDLGYMMPDGGVTQISRIGDVLRIGGYLVNPMEIEEAVISVSGVLACQVVAININNSVRPVAFVEHFDGYQHDEVAIVDACRGKLAVYKSPIRVFEIDAFPVTDSPNGKKVKKNVLKDMAEQLIKEKGDRP